ncbi:MAG: bifunctional UDP-N-acetylglucosamine diphosphorylase/glucosamine-1-phosphate N-acetyltransferase GlmU [Candidatus Geothermincolia bacterium]
MTEQNKDLAVVVLAAGKGKRMKSDLPKVLHCICGAPLVGYVLEAVGQLHAGEVTVVVGNGSQEVIDAIGEGYRCVLQAEQNGTGHAVMVALEGMDPRFKEVLVLAGDAPLITARTLERLVEARRLGNAAASLLTADLDDPTGYGRIIRNSDGTVKAIVEEVDATDAQRAIREVNSCTYVFDRAALVAGLGFLTTENAQGEYYLTDVVEGFAEQERTVVAVKGEAHDAFGVNDRSQLAQACAIMRRRVNADLMAAGVTIVDPSNTYIDYGVEIGSGSTIMPVVFMTGKTTIGNGCSIGPCTSVNDSTVGDGTDIQFSVVDGCRISSGVSVGPFSRLRPGTVLEESSKAGSFVEMKNTTVGRGSKVPHLSYMGDARIGENSNVGAGSITCNYDGENKYPTEIGDGAFIGSDTMLVAPVRIGDDATTGAGSVISKDVPDGSLGIERTEQANVLDWKSRKKGKKDPEK